MCNGCDHGFECCAYDGFHCGCGTELTLACIGEYCEGCGVWFDPECEDHNHDDPDFEDPPYADAEGPVVPVPTERDPSQRGVGGGSEHG